MTGLTNTTSFKKANLQLYISIKLHKQCISKSFLVDFIDIVIKLKIYVYA